MPTAKQTEDEKDWGEGDSNNPETSTAQNGSQTNASPSSPQGTGKPAAAPPPVIAAIPRNASRDDLLRIRGSAENALKDYPDYAAAKAVVAECNERLRYFTPSGLAVPRTSSVTNDDSGADKEADTDEFPETAAAARALHKKIKALPVKTIRQRDQKRRVLSALANHIIKLESGLPVIHLDANDQARQLAMAGDTIKREKLKILSRTIPEVKQLLAEAESAQKSIDLINASLQDASKTIAELAKENAELHELLKKP